MTKSTELDSPGFYSTREESHAEGIWEQDLRQILEPKGIENENW